MRERVKGEGGERERERERKRDRERERERERETYRYPLWMVHFCEYIFNHRRTRITTYDNERVTFRGVREREKGREREREKRRGRWV